MKNLYSAGIIIYTVEQHIINYLLLRYTAGHWDFPKGNIERGETGKEAALRELYEETGLIVSLNTAFKESLSYQFKNQKKQWVHKEVQFFIGKASTTHIVLSHEHTDFCWLPFEEAINKLTFANAKQVLIKANTFIASSRITLE